MKTYEVTYFECYSNTYTVKAKSKGDAEELVAWKIREGEFKGPMDCYDSGFSSVMEV